jgi:O-methyltransferase / aklanonic acid methyltransferase
VDDVHTHMAGAYDRAAPTYERTGVANHAPFAERLAQLVLLGPGGRVLDVGCGAGGALLPAARRVGPTGEAIGIDQAPGMVERAREAAAEAGLEQVRVEVMDGAALTFEEESFDAVLCAFTLSAIPEADKALAEMRRVLRPTGTVGVAVWENLLDRRWWWEGELLQEFAPEVPPELLAAAGAMTSRYVETEPLRAGLEAAGFRDVNIGRMDIEFTFPSAESWWEWVLSGGARAFYEALPDASRDRFRDAGLERLRGAGTDALSRHFIALLAHAKV